MTQDVTISPSAILLSDPPDASPPGITPPPGKRLHMDESEGFVLITEMGDNENEEKETADAQRVERAVDEFIHSCKRCGRGYNNPANRKHFWCVAPAKPKPASVAVFLSYFKNPETAGPFGIDHPIHWIRDTLN